MKLTNRPRRTHAEEEEKPRLVSPGHAARSAVPRWLQGLLTPLLPAALLTWWVTGTVTGSIPQRVLPGPFEIWEAIQRLTENGEILRHLRASLARAGAGLFTGGIAGCLLGLVTGLSTLGNRLIDPLIQAIRTIPPLALLSLFILWFGVGEAPKVALIALGAAFPLYINTVGGIRAVDTRLLEAAKTYGVKPRRRIISIVLPQTLPSIFSGIRLAASISIMLLVAAEQVSTAGLGFLLLQGQSYFDTAQVIVVLLVYALLGMLVDLLVRFAERLALPWTGRETRR